MIFEDIYKEYGSKVYRLCLGYTNDDDWAKDLVQETFIQVWKNLSKFRGESSIGTWIFRIAANICLRQIENHKKMEKAPLPPDLKHETGTDENEELLALRQCITGLEETERLLISMVLEDIAYPEIAKIFGITEGNLRVKVHRIKRTLLNKLKNYEKF